MGDNIDRIIKNTEDRWLNSLFETCKKQFLDCHLPSHNEDHHQRVWNYSKLLLKHLPKETAIHEENIEQLIIAIFFHDQGMSITPSKDHGKISRQLCKTFFEKNQLKEFPHFDLVLNAIESHDKKEYSGHDTYYITNPLQLLTIADDLDAFGIIGAYRYIEIYLLRKINIHDLPDKVINNMNSRFSNFSESFRHDKQFSKSQNMRYIAARNFFKDLNMQVKLVEYSQEMLNGPIGVVNYIQNSILTQKTPLKKAISEALSISADFYFSHFFEKLDKEI